MTNQTEQPATREQIRTIWRPLYDLGVKGQEQISGEYMAHVVSVAVTETQALLANQQRQLVDRLMAGKTELLSPYTLNRSDAGTIEAVPLDVLEAERGKLDG